MDETLKNQLQVALQDEQSDIEKYGNLTGAFEKANCDNIAGVLKDIMHDEESHKKALEMILKD